MVAAAYAFSAGVFFSFLQFSYFFVLESQLSSAALTYFATTCAWLAGACVGLSVKRRRALWVENAMTLGSASAFLVLSWWIRKNPFIDSYLGAYLALVGFSGTHAGYFFASNPDRMRSARNLFLWENNGFILGLALSFLSVTMVGKSALGAGVMAMCLAVSGLQSYLWKKEEADRREFDPILGKFIVKT